MRLNGKLEFQKLYYVFMNKQLIYIFILILGFHYTTCAQTVVVDEKLQSLTMGIPNRLGAHTYFDKITNRLFLTFMDKKTLYVNIYEDFVKKQRLLIERTEDSGLFNQIMDAVLIKDQIYLFFSNPTFADFSAMSIDLKNGISVRFPESLKIGRKELYLYSFNNQNDYYIITSVRKSSTIKLYKFNFETHSFESESYNFNYYVNNKKTESIPIPIWNIINSDDNLSYFRPDLYTYSKLSGGNSEIDFKLSARYTKFYPQDGHLKISFDGLIGSTLLYDIDLKNKNFDFKEYSYFSYLDKDDFSVSNSYFFENFLLHAISSQKRLILIITDLDNPQNTKTYSAFAGQEKIHFSNSPIMKFEPPIFSDYSKFVEEKNVGRFLSNLGYPNIYLNAHKNVLNQIEVSIGYYYIEYMAHAGTVPPGEYRLSGSTQNFAEFKSLFSENFSEHLPQKISSSKYHSIFSKHTEIPFPLKSKISFYLNGKYYLGYFVSPNSNSLQNEYHFILQQFD